MARICPTFRCSFFLVSVLVLLSPVISELGVNHSSIKFLPGFQGPLPFHLETGYVGVGESEEVQLFYYFVKSERNPKDDPLMLWLTGGHGCSALTGLLFEIGPLNIKVEEYNGSLPSLVLNPDSWTQVASIIFLDLPANTGFSYTKFPDPEGTQRSDSKQILHGLQFLRKWLIDHPEFLSNSFYIGGDSHSGIVVPAIALEILKGNEAGLEPSINFEGYLLGNPLTNESIDFNSRIPYAHGMGLISDELYQSLKSTCGGEYVNVDTNNKTCKRYIEAYNSCVSGIMEAHILERKCVFVSPKPGELIGRRFLDEKSEFFLPSEPELPTIGCRSYGYLLSQYWANNDTVREALSVRKGSIGLWKRCRQAPYTQDIHSSIPFHVNLSTKGYRALVYSGDHDLLIPFRGTQEWIRSLNYSIVDDWRQWLVQGQVAGYQRTYSNGMTFATVKDGGHTAPEYRPKECFAMFERYTRTHSNRMTLATVKVAGHTAPEYKPDECSVAGSLIGHCRNTQLSQGDAML